MSTGKYFEENMKYLRNGAAFELLLSLFCFAFKIDHFLGPVPAPVRVMVCKLVVTACVALRRRTPMQAIVIALRSHSFYMNVRNSGPGS